MNKLKILAPILIVVLLGFPTVLADYSDNFDQYTSGTTSPWNPGNPWTQSTTGTAACFTGTSVLNLLPGPPLPISSPNIYNFEGANTAGCFAGVSTVALTGTFNSTLPITSLSFYYYPFTVTGSNSTPWLFTVSVCGSAITSLVGLDHATQKWYKVSYTASSATGCSIFFKLSSVNGGSPANVDVLIDNVVVKGADAVFSNANLFLETFATTGFFHQNPWFNITNFAGSKVIVNYTTGNAFIMANLTAPDVHVPLTNAKLVTVYVGTYCAGSVCTTPYYRSVIPTSTTHQIVYLDSPITQTVIQYQLQVLDFSQQFPAGTTIKLFVGNSYTGSNQIASGYLDSNHLFSAGLQPGRYGVVLTNGANSFTSSITLVNSQASATITVPSLQINYPQNQQTAEQCLGFWNGALTSIIGIYVDNTTTTTSVTITLFAVNNTGTYTIHADTFSAGPYGHISDTFANGSGYNIFKKYGQSYNLKCAVTNTFGSFTFPSTNGQPVLGGLSGTTAPNFPDVFHFAAFLPNLPNPATQFGGLAVLTTVGATFSEFFGPIGLLVVAFFAAFLISGGWIAISVAAGGVLVFISILGLLSWLERRNR